MARVAVVQMVSTASVKINLMQLEFFFRSARDQDAQLILLPENFAFMGLNEKDKLNIAEVLGEGEIQSTISQLARRFNLWVIAGTIPIKTQTNRVRSSSIVYDSKGQRVTHYDKIHLFDVRVSEQEFHQESSTVEAGENIVTLDTPVGRVGLTICYDLRFPELYRKLALDRVELFVVPSAFTEVTGRAHWEVLLRARAIENLCYVLAANQGGIHENGRSTYGHSMIIGPWGDVLSQMQLGAGVITSEIDLPYLHKLRQQFPCNEHHVIK